jgi:hypothetical protein
VTFGTGGASAGGPTEIASIGSAGAGAESAGKLANFAIIACTCSALAGSEAMLVKSSGSFTVSYNAVSPESNAMNLCVSVSTPRPFGTSVSVEPSGNGTESPAFSIGNSTGDPSGAVIK